MPNFWFDLEIFSETPISAGPHRYAEKAEVMLMTYALEGGEVECWDAAREPMPEAVRHAAEDADTLWWGHNAFSFDWVVIGHALPWLDKVVSIERRRDTMHLAYCHSMPGSLDTLCEMLKIDADKAKHKEGKTLIQLFCKPRPAKQKLRRATRETHPEEWARFVEYAKADISAMREAYRILPKWNYKGVELEVAHLDFQINNRGFQCDLELAEGAMRAADAAKAEFALETQALTGGAVAASTQRDALLAHILEAHGVKLPDMRADTLERRLDDPELPEIVKALLLNRLSASMNSTAKYKRLLGGVSRDGRLRGTAQFCGAGRTGRWAHRLFQPGNLPRPTIGHALIEAGIEAIKTDTLNLIFGPEGTMQLCSSALRGVIIAPSGKKLVVADLSNIEGRKAAWLAGENWKLQAFRDFDAGKGEDLYKVAYGKAFQVNPKTVGKDQRQIGKVMELMLQYQGGVGAFLTGAATYAIDLEAMAEAAWPAIPQEIKDEAAGFLERRRKQKRSTYGLSDRVFIVCDSLKRLWRLAHPQIASYWLELEECVRNAIREPGTTRTCRRLKIRRDGSWLRIGLPSGRALCYPNPELSEKGEISYLGLNQYTRKWGRVKTYAGKIFENLSQASSRDQLAYPLMRIEAEGYKVVLTCHDEVVAEAPDSDEFTSDRLSQLMCSDLGWNKGLPLAAAGFETYRYRKD